MRLPRALSRAALRESPNLLLLLSELRELPSARSELKWITEHVNERAADATAQGIHVSANAIQHKIHRLCYLRGIRGVPLQYLLGNQPFGDSLDIKCRPGVLIPRWETEEWGMRVSRAIRARHLFFIDTMEAASISTGSVAESDSKSQTSVKNVFRVLDLCTGSGCLALLFAEQLKAPLGKTVHITGVDVSPTAVSLARANRRRNAHLFDSNVSLIFMQGDIFSLDLAPEKFDLIIANPPYVSEEAYYSFRTSRAVRQYEPKLALLGGLNFYKRIFEIAESTDANFVACEVSDEEQYREVRDSCERNVWDFGAMQDSAGMVRALVASRTSNDQDWTDELTDLR